MHSHERIGDFAVAFDDQGDGPVVVLLHPFPFDGRILADNVHALIDAGYRTITVDYPGFGDSPPPAAALSITQLAELIEGLLQRLSISHAAVLGVSMGGYVALAFARLFPGRLSALILADTRAAADGPTALKGRADALAAIEGKGVDGYLRQSVPRLLAPHAPSDLLARVLDLAEKRQETLNAGIVALRDRPDRTAELGAIRCPTLVVAGAHDQVSPPEEMRTMSTAIPGARFIEIANAGHLSHVEMPEPFNQAVIDFLRGVPRMSPTRETKTP